MSQRILGPVRGAGRNDRQATSTVNTDKIPSEPCGQWRGSRPARCFHPQSWRHAAIQPSVAQEKIILADCSPFKRGMGQDRVFTRETQSTRRDPQMSPFRRQLCTSEKMECSIIIRHKLCTSEEMECSVIIRRQLCALEKRSLRSSDTKRPWKLVCQPQTGSACCKADPSEVFTDSQNDQGSTRSVVVETFQVTSWTNRQWERNCALS